ncbi:MAG: DUF721 domain-containing protein [bacterium]
MNLDIRFKEIQMVKNWPSIVGKKIAQHARAININDATLFVAVDNPVWQAQLFLLKNKIIDKFNKSGANLKDIKFIIDKRGSSKE